MNKMITRTRRVGGIYVDGDGQCKELPEIVGMRQLLIRNYLVYNRLQSRVGRSRMFPRVLKELVGRGLQLVAGGALEEVCGGLAQHGVLLLVHAKQSYCDEGGGVGRRERVIYM